MSHSAQKFRRGILLCSREILVSKTVREKRGGGYHDFPSKLFCPTVPNHFVEEPFCVSESFGYRKILWTKGGGRGGMAIFCQKFLSHSAEKVRRETLPYFRKILVSKNARDKRGGVYHVFPSKLFCLTVPNHFVEEPFCVSESFGYRKILCLRGEYHDFL